MSDNKIRGWRGGREWRRGARGPTRPSRSHMEDLSSIETTPAPPCGELLHTLTLDEISEGYDEKTQDIRISDCSLVASYNWMDKGHPSIVVPGMPPQWTPLSKPPKLQMDAGTYYRDLNASRYPNHPMEPAVEAIMKTHPNPKDLLTSDSMSIDVMGCGSTFGSLLRFTSGDGRSFRMLVEVVGQTVHLIRRENSPMETLQGVRGFGHTFPEAYTTWDRSVQGSASHQRIVRYRFGGLGCLVRFEGDGYLPDKVVPKLNAKAVAKVNNGQSEAREPSLDDLTRQLGASNVSPAALSQDKKRLDISSAGRGIPQEAIFDLKTRSIKRKPDEHAIVEGEVPRLWLRQISTLILAYHVSGRFTEIETRDVRPDISGWESTHRHELEKFAVLLKRIVDMAKATKGGRLELVRLAGEDLVQIREQLGDTGCAFSPDTMRRWSQWLNFEG